MIREMKKKGAVFSIVLMCALVLFCCLLVFVTTPVFAASCGGTETAIIDCKEGGVGAIWHILLLILNIITGGVGVVGLIGILVFGVQFLTSGGDAAKATKAKNRMVQIAIGLVAFALLWSGSQWLLPGGLFAGPGEVRNISIEFKEPKLEVGESTKALLKVDGDEKSYSLESSDTSIATAYASGVVHCNKPGEVTITAIAADGTRTETALNCAESHEESSGSSTNGSTDSNSNGQKIADLVISMAWPEDQASEGKRGYNTAEYNRILAKWGIPRGTNCSKIATAAILESGVDPDFGLQDNPPPTSVLFYSGTLEEYFRSSPRWEKVTDQNYKPGDIFTCDGSHTYVYVGDGMVAEGAVANANNNFLGVGATLHKMHGYQKRSAWRIKD